MSRCLFCRLIARELPSDVVLETSELIAINDINPKAPTHILILPKRHCERPSQLSSQELTSVFEATEKIASLLDLQPDHFKLQFNVGKQAGQEIDHVHLHLLSWSKKSDGQ